MNHEDINFIEKLLRYLMETIIIGGTIIMIYRTTRKIRKFVLNRKKQKNQETEEIVKIILPPELTNEAEEINIKNIATQSCKEEIVRFSKTLIEKFRKEDLINFYNNIKKLKVETNYSLYNKQGMYDHIKRKIIIDEKRANIVIYHELFHMASSNLKDNILYTGFEHLKKDDKPVGEGINEGYTELLARRYFNANNGAYQLHVLLAEKLEQIIGKEKMESLYLNANQEGLIEELKQYATPEEITKFIQNVDYALNIYNEKISKQENEKICNRIVEINKFLIKCYVKKENSQIKAKTEKEFEEKMLKFINEFIKYTLELSQTVKLEQSTFEITNEETFQEYINIGSDIIGFKIPIEINSKKQKLKI